MNKTKVKAEPKMERINAGDDSIFFRGQHPDKRTPKEWVKYMNKKYPHLKWNGRY